MFIRVKNIHGRRYAYLVENRWRNGSVKQHVRRYLGPVVKLEKTDDTPFAAWKEIDLAAYISNTPQRRILRDLIRHALMQHGFTEREDLTLRQWGPRRNGKEVVLELSGGYYSKYTGTKLINFTPREESRPGQRLAEAFREAGVAIDKTLFILLYRKIHNI